METNKEMTVLVIKPNEHPVVKRISNELESLQHEVDGYIECIYPFDDMVALICNEEGKNQGRQLNRGLYDEDGKLYDIVAGTFLIVGLGEEDLCSLTEEQIEKFRDMFYNPEIFLSIEGKLVGLKYSIE